MKKELLQEGAVAGHMNHIYDNGEMTFGELKQLLQAAVDGRLRGTEKTDGQNVYLSFDVVAQRARAIRNKTHIKAGGLNVEEFDNFFAAHPNQALRYSFVEALQAFEDVVKQLDQEVQLQIFGKKEENIYFNTEVMNPGVPDADPDDPRGQGTTNVIPYDKKTLLIHEVGHSMFDGDTGLPYDNPKVSRRLAKAYGILENSLVGKSTDEQSVFSIETHPRRKLERAGMERASKILQGTFEAIDNVVSDFGLNDSDTIQDLVMVQIKPIIDNFGMTEDRNKAFILRLMGLCKSLEDPEKLIPCGTRDAKTGKRLHHPPINIKDLTAGVPQELSDEIRTFDKGFKYQEYTAALSGALYEFTNAILQDFQSSFIADNQKAIKDLQDEISQSIKKIQSSSNEAAKQDLEKQLKKLQNVQNVNTPSEGFVFNFNGSTYKFTGWFAPSNQILGTERYNRFGPIEPPENEKLPSDAETEALTVAVYPGSFKPPHVGHLKALEKIEERVNSGELPKVEKYYVIISSPISAARPLPSSGKTISAHDAKMMWQMMLENSPIRNKTQIIAGGRDTVSPMKVTIDYVTKQSDPTNLLVAPPNAKVILVVGDKESDAKRFRGLRDTVKEKRPDVELFSGVVPENFHDPKFVELVNKHPSVKTGLKSNYKTLNASDMRFSMDLASQEPVGLEMLKYFLPDQSQEMALAYMGILGLNPADLRDDDSDQVTEPEIDDRDPLQEVIKEEILRVLESFKKQTPPSAKPDSGRFQRKQRKRLSKAHATYLDKGRKDLTKYGGGFHLDRPKNISNAFLAEEEFEEAMSMAGGNIQVGTSALGKKREKPNKRNDEMIKQEKKLRMKIRESLKEFFKLKAAEHQREVSTILEEHRLRIHLRNLLFEQAFLNESEDPTTDVHDNTGINTLKDLFKNTNILSTLRNVYKTLTTNKDQKDSFRAHVLKWTVDTLAPVRLNDVDPTKQTQAVTEDNVGVDILGVETNPDMFLDFPDGSEKESTQEPEQEEEKMKPISGEDTTGRNKAERVYPSIEKSVIDYYGELDNPEDQEMFYDYLIANMKLYFDKWDGEMSASPPEEPQSAEYDQAKSAEA